VPFIRSIGRGAMTGLVINSIIGSGIFGVPSELTRLLGRASPLAMVFAALGMAIIMSAITEVASQFSEPGGPYLYVRRAFGRFLGLQVGWFWLLAMIGGGAANVNLFMLYLAGFVPPVSHGWARAAALTALVAVLTVANYVGVRSGANLSTLLAVAKLLPLGLLIVLGVLRFGQQFQLIQTSEVTGPGGKAWLSAFLLLLFAYGGYENALAPMGEIKEPRRTVPFGLAAGLIVSMIVYALLQFVTVATVGTRTTDRPLADTASVLLGPGGPSFVAVAIMISTYGNIAGHLLSGPRAPYAFSAHGDFPSSFESLHPRYHTPSMAILIFAGLVWILALTGTFLWVAAVTAGSIAIIYGGICAALIRLRRREPRADALRIPWGNTFGVVGLLMCVTLLTRLQLRQALLMSVTALVAAANSWWATHRTSDASPDQKASKVTA
jgi:basic amino acid/polyamine antiporter, APA family